MENGFKENQGFFHFIILEEAFEDLCCQSSSIGFIKN
jgi:hypothetical protein